MKLWQLYVVIGVVAFLLTGSQAIGYADAGFVGGNVDFWQDALTTHDAARFMTYDVILLGLACFVLVWVEGAKLGLAVGWRVAVVAGSVLIGVSTFVPFFLAWRQRRLDAA